RTMSSIRVGRNDVCPCGSGKKFKKCCLLRREARRTAPALQVLSAPAHRSEPVPQQPPHDPAANLRPTGTVEASEEQVIRGTADHPFYVWGKGWTPLGELNPGDWIRTKDGWTEVQGVTDTRKCETVYNFRVKDFHTFFVS